MKKVFDKKILFIFMVGIMLCSGIVYATTLYKATDVSYEPTDESWEVANVSDALNSLYASGKSISISSVAKDASGNDAAVHYYGARISSVTKTFTMNKGKMCYLYLQHIMIYIVLLQQVVILLVIQ